MSILSSLRILVVVAGACAIAQGKTVYVSTAGSDANDGLTWGTAKLTVQAGLNAAAAGDQVWVAAGTYVQCITLQQSVALYGGFAGSETDLSQRDWRTNVTILDGNQAGRVVTAPTGATASTRIDGFTIRNGKTSSSGGGIYCNSSSPAIANNAITDNTAYTGGGIYCYSSAATITNNTITGNTASSTYGGGGIYCSRSSPTITNNAITGNTASSGGGGISCASSATIANNTITGNTASSGGGIYCTGYSPAIINNTITGNTATYGGGIYCEYPSSPTITNNTITGNAASSGRGGGIYCNSSSPTITNTIIAFNCSGIFSSSGTPTLRYCCVYGNSAYNFSGLTDPTGTNGNISVDPQLVDVARGDVHVQPTSPCIDAGDDTAVQAGWTDIDGQARVQGVHVDIGADESNGTSWPAAPAILYVSPSGSDSNDGLSWATAKRTVQAAIDAGGSGSQVWVAAGTYVGTVQLGFGIALYGGFAGTETDLSQRNWRTNLTILDGNRNGSVVTAPPAATASTQIDGFTIRNGNAQSGGGIYCSYSSPMIANNTITGNAAGGGGGIYCYYSSAVITNNTITGNYGAGIYGYCSSPTITDNTITDNSSSGISCNSSSFPTIANNTITGNVGGGIYCSSSLPTITNTIVAFNSSGIYSSSGTLTLRCCCVYGNVAYNYSGLADPTGTNGNISADPQLADVARGNLHLQPTSPCIDAGDDAAVQAGWTDIDGQTRAQGAHVDIGADESDGTVWPAAPAIVYVRPSGNDSNDGLSWATAKRTVQAAIDAGGRGTQVWVAAGTYVGTIHLRFGIALYGGFAGTETDLSQRNWRTNLTILDGNQAGSVITTPTAAMGSTRIDGFTIRNAKASFSGGGIYCYYSSPMIANNTIAGNTGNPGGGIYCCSSSSTIENNTITGNAGGGIYCCSSSSPTITNNTITGNRESYNGGGGIYCGGSSPTITNTIIAFNTSGIYGSSSTPTVRYCCVYGNGAYNYSGITDPTGTNGNISADPQLADIARSNLHLQAASPCVDAGDDTAVQAGWTDIDGQMRIQGTHVDIGADESDGTSWPAAAAIVYVSPSGNDSNDGLSWGSAKRTVQAGIDVGGTGSQVWVAAGTYVGTIQLRFGMALYGGFAGNETALSQRSWRTNVTILDGNQAGSVVTAPPAATASTQIDGFTIRNGNTSSYGGGIYCYFSSPTIANNTITGNTGTGIYCSWSSAVITNNTITGNTTSSYGGGISVNHSSPAITNNIISNNTGYVSGGGIYCDSSSLPTIANNTITGNALTVSPSYGDYNSYGGGIYCDSSLTIVNNTITGNSSGGIYCSSATIINTIIAFNSSGVCNGSPSSVPILRCCCVYGNGTSNFSGLTDPTGTNGNISADPQLVYVARGSLHAQPTSPCIDAGDDAAVQAGWTDIDGQARVQGAHVDMGADESDGTLWPATIFYVSPSGSDSNDGLSWSSAKRTVQAGIDAGGEGSQVWVAAGTYVGTIRVGFGMSLYGGFAGNETDLSQRNWRTNVTILDGNQAGSVVTTPATATASTRVDGFTIRNGSASSGGGIYCYYSSPTISNNTITGNTGSSIGGGGIYCYFSSATITNNTVTGNTASGNGGGISCVYSSATITNNTIMGNTASNGGGGIYCNSSATIANNTITGNTAVGGGGIWCDGSSPTITNNTIIGNTASYDGGGIYCYYSPSPAIVNTIIAFNSSGIYSYSGTPTLHYCCVYGNASYNYSGLSDPSGSNGNIMVDPLFVHQTAPYDLHLLGNSPCINAGDPSFNGNGLVDLDSKARVFGGRVDMGAYEFVPGLPDVPGNPAPTDGQINVLVNPTLSWSGAALWVTFDVYLDTVNPPVTKIASGVSAATLSPLLVAGTRYYWQVVAIDVSGQTPGPVWSFATHVVGDINGDGFVNVGDLQRLVAAWGSDNSGGWGNWNANADLNNDGYVNVSDLQILVSNWGKAVK